MFSWLGVIKSLQSKYKVLSPAPNRDLYYRLFSIPALSFVACSIVQLWKHAVNRFSSEMFLFPRIGSISSTDGCDAGSFCASCCMLPACSASKKVSSCLPSSGCFFAAFSISSNKSTLSFLDSTSVGFYSFNLCFRAIANTGAVYGKSFWFLI